ncbi:MAG: response regulator [Bacteroidota bacterium]
MEEVIEILLIEDNEGDIVLTKKAFEDGKIRNNLNVCRDGQEGLDYLFRRGEYHDSVTPDLILLDLNMPKLGGREVLERIKNDERLSSIPVVILTTSEDETDILKSYQLHANSYVKKPVDFFQFVDVVREIQSYWFTIVKIPSKPHVDVERLMQ